MSGGPPASRSVVIVNQKGLHARAAAKMVALASQFKCRIEVSRNDLSASGHSIMGLLTLGAAQHTTVALEATGPEADIAIEALAGLIAAGFYEQD